MGDCRAGAGLPHHRIPIPKGLVIEAGAFVTCPTAGSQLARGGEAFSFFGNHRRKPSPTFELFASGLDEIFGLAYKDDAFRHPELRAYPGDGPQWRRAGGQVRDDLRWVGYEYHEYAFGTKFDPEGNLYVALGLSNSYHSRALFRGWAMKITPDGKTIPIASGLRSPGGIGPNEHGALFYIESQGPWNSSCSLKFLKEGGFMGHPVSFNWYEYAKNLKGPPKNPESGGRIVTEKMKVKELVPYAVIFPYIRMGRSISGFVVNRTKGKFGPFENQIFIGDYTQSIVMRATTEKVNGVWQGACYPFREGFSTGILNLQFTPEGTFLGWNQPGLAGTRQKSLCLGENRLDGQDAF